MKATSAVFQDLGKFVQSVKYGCEQTGLHPGPPRLPLQPLTTDEKSKLELVIATLKKDISKIIVSN
jgi:4-hydroxy-tetrahydrodipicolinate synthase